MDFIKKTPVSVCGIALGFAALGNLLQSYSEVLCYGCVVISFALVVLYALKWVVARDEARSELENPVAFSVLGTLPMSVMLLSVYVKPAAGDLAAVLWVVAIIAHLLLMGSFTDRYIRKDRNWKNVHASWFIVYVGIVVASVTAPTYESEAYGSVFFVFGLLASLALLGPIAYRYAKFPAPEVTAPLACIFAAPTSLCVAGYVQSVTPKDSTFLIALLIVTGVLYVGALIWCARCLAKPFYPSHAALTFPFVFGAVACKQSAACLSGLGQPVDWLGSVATVQMVVAVALCLLALARMLMFLGESAKPKPAKSKSEKGEKSKVKSAKGKTSKAKSAKGKSSGRKRKK